MKIALALLLSTSATVSSNDPSTLLSPENREEASALMKAYNSFTDSAEALPLNDWSSLCEGPTCAFNFATDREDFGILAKYKSKVDLKGRTVAGFRVDPNGVAIFDGDTSIPGVDLENAVFASKIEKSNSEKLAAKLQKDMGGVLGIKGKLLKNDSECRTSSEAVWCAFNFKNGRKTTGVAIEGLMSEHEQTIYHIEGLESSDQAVYLP